MFNVIEKYFLLFLNKYVFSVIDSIFEFVVLTAVSSIDFMKLVALRMLDFELVDAAKMLGTNHS